jgi:hypothetical protein
MASASTLVKSYGKNLSTRAYLDARSDMPDGLRDIIAIHTLNAGVAPDQTLAIFATMSAVMADEGVFVPTGGVYEIALAFTVLPNTPGRPSYSTTRSQRWESSMWWQMGKNHRRHCGECVGCWCPGAADGAALA